MSPSIEDYIRSERKRGVTEAQLRQALSSYYTIDIINHAFESVAGAAQKKLYLYMAGILGVIIVSMSLFFFYGDEDDIPDTIVNAPLQGISTPFDDALEVSSGSMPSCGEYCRKVMEGCVGEHAQYLSNEGCMQYCGSTAAIPPGNYGSVQDNTLGCRIKSAELASELNPEDYCLGAGPFGGGSCGSWCDNYCSLQDRACSEAYPLYDSDAECSEVCEKIPRDGDHEAVSGDSIQCRLHQLKVAFTSPTFFCPRAAVSSEVCREAVEEDIGGDVEGYADDQTEVDGESPELRSGEGEGVSGSSVDELEIVQPGTDSTSDDPVDLSQDADGVITVTIKDFAFEPGVVLVDVGQTIIWTNEDAFPHQVQTEDGSVQSATLNQGDSFAHTFTVAGTYSYICGIHPAMKGTIIVGNSI